MLPLKYICYLLHSLLWESFMQTHYVNVNIPDELIHTIFAIMHFYEVQNISIGKLTVSKLPGYPKDACLLIFLKCCPQNLSFRNLMLGEYRWKHIVQEIFQAHKTRYFSQLLKTDLLLEATISQAQAAFICLNSSISTIE